MTDDEKLTELEGRASKGPWAHIAHDNCEGQRVRDGIDGPDGVEITHDVVDASDAELIVAMRNALPDLLTELHTLRQRNARLVEGLREAEREIAMWRRANSTGEFIDDGLSMEVKPVSVLKVIAGKPSKFKPPKIKKRPDALKLVRTLIEDNSNG